MKTACLTTVIAVGVLALACHGELPTGPGPLRTKGTQAGVTKQTIRGSIRFAGAQPPDRRLVTPGGMCHFFDLPIFARFTGDIEGLVTYHEMQNKKCDGTHLVASGPFDGQVTWNGRSGMISGQFTTNCMPDASQRTGLSCDGMTTARGSGGLEGVQFHFEWGPGWYPFSYTGTAFSK